MARAGRRVRVFAWNNVLFRLLRPGKEIAPVLFPFIQSGIDYQCFIAIETYRKKHNMKRLAARQWSIALCDLLQVKERRKAAAGAVGGGVGCPVYAAGAAGLAAGRRDLMQREKS